MCGKIDFSKYFGGAGVHYTGSGFEKKIKDAFSEKLPDVKVVFFDETDSTNTRAKLYAKDREDRVSTVFIARRQTAGRGRLGRSFLSEEGGLYMSYLSYPDLPAEDAIKLTAYAAVALCDTVREFCGAEPGIKWVNDCFIGEKKLAGILTEGVFSEDGLRFEYTVVGIGVNLSRVNFGELSDIATDLETECGSAVDVSDFAASLAEKLSRFESSDPTVYMKRYSELSVLTGRRVKVITPTECYFAKVLGVNLDGSLSIITDSGDSHNLISGDVSVRLD